MERLDVCGGCSRHLRGGERACPHCGEPLVARTTKRGRLGAAVVVTASLVGPACGSSGGSDHNDVERDQGGEIIEPGDVVIDLRNRHDAGPGTSVADAGPPPTALDAGPPEEIRDIDRDRLRMPYGAPPARPRLV